MSRFRVWAPNAKQAEVQAAGQRVAMTAEPEGWWVADVPTAGPGTDYGFRIDGSQLLPDPRSAWQPHGVHDLSRMVDHSEFPWTDQNWQAKPLSAGVLYELHIGTFTPAGTFEAAVGKLDFVVDLGVTHVEIMPVAAFPGRRGWGYDGVDLYAPQEGYGGPEGLKRLVNACHERRLGVILDVMYNHFGPAGNYLTRFGPYFTSKHMTPWGEAINFDGPASNHVRRFIIDNALMWLRDYHFDGLRLDAVHQILDNSAVHILEQMTKEVETLEAHLGRHFFLIGESDLNNPRLVWKREIGGYNLNSQWNEDFHHALHTVLTGERDGYYMDFGQIWQLAKTLEKAFAYDGRYSLFRQRNHGRPATGLPGECFIGCLQNHDQVGNRAAGERIGFLVNANRLKVGAALVITSPFVPMLFMGEEWAASSPFQYFTDHGDPDLARAVSEGRRKEFGAFGWKPEDVPDPQDPRTFERSKLRWDEINREPHASMLQWYKQLIRLRRTTPDLNDGEIGEVHAKYSEAGQWMCIERRSTTTVCNLRQQPQCVPVDHNRSLNILLTSDASVSITPEGIHMPPESVVILGPEPRRD